jgi:hypothetical protein
MLDRILLVLALAVLFGFLGILAWFVPRVDLTAVILLTAALVIYDFYFHDRRKNGGKA